MKDEELESLKLVLFAPAQKTLTTGILEVSQWLLKVRKGLVQDSGPDDKGQETCNGQETGSDGQRQVDTKRLRKTSVEGKQTNG